MQKLDKANWSFNIALYTTIVIGSFMAVGYIFPVGGNFPEVPPIEAMLNPELYKLDYYVQEMLNITPRYYYYYSIYSLAKLGVSIPLVHLIYQLLAFASFILASYALVSIFSPSKLAAAVMAFLGLVASFTDVGNTLIFSTKSVPSIFAMAFAIWGVYFCLRQKWYFGYLCFGLGCLLQFLVGLLPGAMMFPLLGMAAIKKKRYTEAILSLLILGVMVSFVYVPMLLNGNTSTHLIDNTEFVYIHTQVRNPHHILPSTWGLENWLNFFCFLASGCFCIQQTDALNREDKLKFNLLLLTSALALFLNYVFVEVIPSPLVAKLQLARTVPFAQILIFIALSLLVCQLYRQGQIALSFLLIVVPTLPFRGIFLAILAVIIWSLKTKSYVRTGPDRWVQWLMTGGTLLLVLAYPPTTSLDVLIERLVSGPILFLILALPLVIEKLDRLQKNKQKMALLSAITISLIFVLGISKQLPHPLLDTFQKRVDIDAVPNDDLTKLALRLSQNSSLDSLVLVPPSVTNFQFFSKRAIVVNFKNFPFTDRGIKEWKSRMEAILGEPLNPQMIWGGNDLFRRRRGSDLIQVARIYKADYLLTRTDWHSDIASEIADREGNWILYKLP